MVADLTIVRADLDDDPSGRWHHARMVADWGLDYYRAELDALDRLARGIAGATTDAPPIAPAATRSARMW